METIDRIVAAGLDAIESQVVLIDEDGVIVYTNDAWDEFGRENGLEGEPIGPGTIISPSAGPTTKPKPTQTLPARASNPYDGDADRSTSNTLP